ncbi:MAG: hypothetical protein NZ879_05720 [Archaeoglobaceae archaeon]|nr:hypothetical protein [Archaeoglobaceae archaeon]MDW8118465.1 hypothetical protein [Archaeoglobaceae archaeon]
MIYPGQYEYWQIVWIQIILLVYVQFITAFSLYTQKDFYSKFFKIFERFFPWKGRDFLIKLHAFSGISVFVLNVLCTTTWFYLKISGGLSIFDILTSGETAIIGWVNLASTVLISLMLVFGVSLYKNNRPDTKLPFWKFEYYLSRIIHRLVFLLIIVILGYHVFFISKIFNAWNDWILMGHLFVLLPITSIIIGILAFLLAFVLVYEIIAEKMRIEKKVGFSKTFIFLTLIFVFYIVYVMFLQPFPIEILILSTIFLAFVQVSSIFKSKKAPRIFYEFKPVSKDELIERISKMGVYGENLEKAINETLEHALKVWKESMEFGSELEYCGSIFAELSIKKDVNEINELEDTGKMLAMFFWQNLNKIGNDEAKLSNFISEIKRELGVRS